LSNEENANEPHDDEDVPDREDASNTRRRFLRTTASVGMAGGLIGGYGTFASVAGRFLDSPDVAPRAWMFVSVVDDLEAGSALEFIGPAGETISVARKAVTGALEDFVALSSVCPHLGCQVHWQGDHSQFFCPCHNGTFDSDGVGTGGPPAKDGLSLDRYPLKIDRGLLFIEVPVGAISQEDRAKNELRRAAHAGCSKPSDDKDA
jgi:Rieske Fe-S protein